ERQRLPGRCARGAVEIGIDRVLAVEPELHLRDVAIARVELRLHEVDPAGGDGVVEDDADLLADAGTEGSTPPRGLDVAVERARGGVFGRVGDRVPVAGGRGPLDSALV